MPDKEDHIILRELADLPADLIRASPRDEIVPGCDLPGFSESFPYNGRSLLSPDKRACGYDIKEVVVRCHPECYGKNLIPALTRETAICIGHPLTGSLCFPVTENEDIHTMTKACRRINLVIKKDYSKSR